MKDFEGKAHYPIDLESLPKAWACAFVGEICDDVQSGFASGEHNSRGSGVPHLRPMNIDRLGRVDMAVVKSVAATTDKRRLRRGDVLFNNTNSPVLVGKTAPICRDDDVAFSNHMTRLRPHAGIDCEFLAYELHYLWMGGYFLHRCSKHVNQASVSAETLASSVPVVVPPTVEQRRIVDAVDSYLTRLDDAVASLERAQAKLKAYRASVLKAAVEGRLVPTEASLARAEKRNYEPADVLLARILKERRRRWEEAVLARLKAAGKTPKDDKWKAKYEEPPAPNTAALPKLPAGWCWATVDQLTDGARNSGYGVLVPGPHVAEGVPLIRVGDIHDGTVSTNDLKRISRVIADRFSKTYLRGGEVLLSLVGTIGRSAVAPTSLSGANVARAVAMIPTSILVRARWVEMWFRSPDVQQLMESRAHEVARKTLNLEDVRAAIVALPPMEEQDRIIVESEDCDSLASAAASTLATNITRCARLRQSILKWAFEGKLVDQDPADEPAEKLLARIRAERAAAVPAQRVNGRRRRGAA